MEVVVLKKYKIIKNVDFWMANGFLYAKIYKKRPGVELVIPSDNARIPENYPATLPLSE